MFVSTVKLDILTWGSMTRFGSQPQVAIEEQQVLETMHWLHFSALRGAAWSPPLQLLH